MALPRAAGHGRAALDSPGDPMQRIVNFGSCNIDTLLGVPHLVKPGETLTARSHRRMAGGKGLNQSLAAARAGASVVHVGAVGEDGAELVALLRSAGVDVSRIHIDPDHPTGHALVQISDDGENSIVIVPGANRTMPRRVMTDAVDDLADGDWLLLQNEVEWVPEAIARAGSGAGRVALNLAPAEAAARDWPLERLDLLVVNETEAGMLTDCTSPDDQLQALVERCPRAWIALTLGGDGARLTAGAAHPQGPLDLHQPAFAITVTDTTGAGDAFTGHLLAALADGRPPQQALGRAVAAGALACTREGAADAIPTARAVDALLASIR